MCACKTESLQHRGLYKHLQNASVPGPAGLLQASFFWVAKLTLFLLSQDSRVHPQVAPAAASRPEFAGLKTAWMRGFRDRALALSIVMDPDRVPQDGGVLMGEGEGASHQACRQASSCGGTQLRCSYAGQQCFRAE